MVRACNVSCKNCITKWREKKSDVGDPKNNWIKYETSKGQKENLTTTLGHKHRKLDFRVGCRKQKEIITNAVWIRMNESTKRETNFPCDRSDMKQCAFSLCVYYTGMEMNGKKESNFPISHSSLDWTRPEIVNTFPSLLWQSALISRKSRILCMCVCEPSTMA